MALSKEQITSLINMVASVERDELDCDDCFGRIAEFAELHLADQEIPVALRTVQTHLEQCACCKDEFNALLKALQTLDEGSSGSWSNS